MVATMKGLVGGAGRNSDLAPTATANSGGSDRFTKFPVSLRHHSGRGSNCLQQILRRTSLGAVWNRDVIGGVSD
jgi:hypothetical protein